MIAEEITKLSLNESNRGKAQERFMLDRRDAQHEENDTEVMKIILEEDPSIFLLNNLLMSVQFFQNYERDVELLRENWYKEVTLDSHYKKCFHADSLFKICGENVKFVPRHGLSKNSQLPLQPFRIYVSSDNVEAAFDPSVLGRNKLNLWPQYQFTVRTDETIEKSGYISLIEFKTIEAPIKSPKTKTPKNNFVFHDAVINSVRAEQQFHYYQRKSVFEEKYSRRLTKTEKLISFQNRKASLKMGERRTSLKHYADDCNDFYKFTNSEAKLTPVCFKDFRMNMTLPNSIEIPLECFQKEEIRKKFNSRRSILNECFKSQNILNSAAFKGYFCDLLMDKLSGALNFDLNDINESFILEEFITVRQKGVQYNVTPVIRIRDWVNFVAINKNFHQTTTKLSWPSPQMVKILNVLPCDAVPVGYSDVTEENLYYEKTWKLVFPKSEEFLILHMMSAHVRCYFFLLLLYKTFIEPEINSASFGPKHILHLLFWRVHKNFLAWPEDRSGETLINYLKVLYKKLQNKVLYDFFITTRNLFADSLAKDLHKAQVLIKKIIENPLPYVMRALRNLTNDDDFYPSFDISKLNTILNSENVLEKMKKATNKKKQRVTFQDEEQRWKKMAMKQINMEKKAEEEQARKESIQSINLDKVVDLNTKDYDKCSQILTMFTSHFIEMGNKSLQYNCLSQAFFYLNQTEKLAELSMEKGLVENDLRETRQKIKKLKEGCYGKLKLSPSGKLLQNATDDNSIKLEKPKMFNVKPEIQKKETEKVYADKQSTDEDEVYSIKL